MPLDASVVENIKLLVQSKDKFWTLATEYANAKRDNQDKVAEQVASEARTLVKKFDVASSWLKDWFGASDEQLGIGEKSTES